MSSVPTSPTGAFLRSPLVDERGLASKEFARFLNDLLVKTQNTLTLAQQLSDKVSIQGKTAPLATIIGSLGNDGKLQPDGVGFNTDAIPDGTGSPLAGGKRGFQALSPANRLADTFRNTAVNTSLTPTGATSLSNDGVSTAIHIAAGQNRFAPSAVSYGSGTVDPGVFGTFFVYADDPTFAGGAVTYQFTTVSADQTANEGRVPFGLITTTLATPQTGGGNTGGSTPGGGGGRGYQKF